MSGRYSRIAIITGSTSGFGEAVANKFISTGFGVVGTGRNKEMLAKIEQDLGNAFYGLSGDASDDAFLESLFTAAVDRFKRPADVVVANAGRGLGGSVKDADLDQFQDMLDVNVTGTLMLLQKAARQMVKKQSDDFPDQAADIVIIGSVAGRNISPFSAVYGASKSAVHSLAEGLRREVSPLGVRVSLVEPGLALSGFQAAAGYDKKMVTSMVDRYGPVLAVMDIADAVYYIVSRPPNVHVSDMVVRPTRMDYP